MAPAALTLALAVPALAVLPVTSTAAPAPEPVRTAVTSLPLAGVDAAALAAQSTASRSASAAARAEAAPLERGAAPAATPAVLTPERRTAPFSTVGVSWDRPAAATELTVLVRTHGEDGWTGWTALEESGEVDPSAPDPAALPVLTDPLYVGPSDGVQVRVDVRTGRLPQGLEVSLVDPGASDYDGVGAGAGQPASRAAAAAPQPAIRSRAQWGADESRRKGSPSYMATVRAGALHHTAGTNGYSQSEVPAIIRGDYAYHLSQGWSDIGYHFLVDRFGTVWEGRAGGITKAVQGAHAGGFNSETMSVSVLGNYETAASNAAVVDSVAKVFGWKLSLFGRDPQADVTLTSAGGGTSKYRAGTRATVKTLFAHRDVGYTLCPGANLFSQMGTIRAKAAAYARTSGSVTAPSSPAPLPPGAVVRPLVGDWDGDGRDDVGWYAGGRWTLREGDGSLATFTFGRATDVPVVGDWDRDGRDGVGVFRGGRWFLKDAFVSGPHETTFSYGTAGDRPVVGAWQRRGLDGIGVVRGREWLLRYVPGPGSADLRSTPWGRASDVPVVGDWDRDGTETPGLFRGGWWFLSDGAATPGAQVTTSYGRSSMQPAPGDWDGNGSTTLGVASGSSFLLRGDLYGGPATSSVRLTR
ncbi:N-acetylmuramoyl-L-alanine amidase [Vallicoccus soli]|nr:N-acetylmuramoyl-L-alanine amidase [Vallicoccus soli]